MKYRLKMSDIINDKSITKEVEAKSVFDAIDIVAKTLDNPESVELIEASPILDDCKGEYE